MGWWVAGLSVARGLLPGETWWNRGYHSVLPKRLSVFQTINLAKASSDCPGGSFDQEHLHVMGLLGLLSGSLSASTELMSPFPVPWQRVFVCFVIEFWHIPCDLVGIVHPSSLRDTEITLPRGTDRTKDVLSCSCAFIWLGFSYLPFQTSWCRWCSG